MLRLLIAASLSASSLLGAVSYQVTNLGTLGGNLSAATAINNSAQIAGYATPSFGSSRAFLHEGGAMSNLVPALGRWSYAYGINQSGQIVGHANILVSQPSADTAFLYSAGTTTLIPTLGGASGYALGINSSGQVVGNSFLANNTTRHAYIYSNGVATDLTPTIGARSSYARGINDAGLIVGSFERTSAMDEIAFRWNGSSFQTFDLGGSRSYGYGINAAGHVVGQATISDNVTARAFLFDGENVINLGTLGGSNSIAYAINDFGVVVGSSFTVGNIESRAAILEGTTLVDLNLKIDVNSGWVLREALAVNNSGWIVGYGDFEGSQRAFLLTPVPEPSTVGALLGALAFLVALRRRR